jgi:cobalt-zinc-cadmium efflux system outer membrane protein
MISFLRFILPACGLLLLAGCTTSAPRAALPDVQSKLQARAGVQATWPLTTDERTQADASVRELLGHDLTVSNAVQIALLNNRGLRATFEELGLSQAALGAAARLPNPTLSASVRWPQDPPRGPNAEFGLTAPLLDSLLLPLRQRVARERLVQAQQRVAHEVLTLVADVKLAAFEVLARQELRASLATAADLGTAADDLAQRQFDAGNTSRLERLQAQAQVQQSRLELLRAEADLGVAREQLSRLLGLTGAQTGWRLAGGLPALPNDPTSPDNFETLALGQRLDLAAARQEIDLAKRALDLRRSTRLLPGTVDAGVDTERDSGGGRVTGPRLELQLPLFDQGQAEIARLEAAWRQAEDRAEALASDIGSDVRTARDALAVARQAAGFFEETLLPQRRLLLRETLLQYNAMQRSPYDVLRAREQQRSAERGAIEARRDYWLARTRLERALGGPLP